MHRQIERASLLESGDALPRTKQPTELALKMTKRYVRDG
jgi:hypothetical protein